MTNRLPYQSTDLIMHLVPVRCITCSKVLANKQDAFEERVNSGMTIEKALDSLAIHNDCCRITMQRPDVIVAGGRKEAFVDPDDLDAQLEQMMMDQEAFRLPGTMPVYGEKERTRTYSTSTLRLLPGGIPKK